MRKDTLLALILLLICTLGCRCCSGDCTPQEPTPTPYKNCFCTKTSTNPATGDISFMCDGNNSYSIPYLETLGNAKEAERLVKFRCMCDWQAPPNPDINPTLYQCWYDSRPKWHVQTSAALWQPTICRADIPHDLNGVHRTLACVQNKFLKKGDQIVMCYGRTAYDQLAPDEKAEINTNWTIESKPADSFHCTDSVPGNPMTQYEYWILTKK